MKKVVQVYFSFVKAEDSKSLTPQMDVLLKDGGSTREVENIILLEEAKILQKAIDHQEQELEHELLLQTVAASLETVGYEVTIRDTIVI
jgi:hypothetical protein